MTKKSFLMFGIVLIIVLILNLYPVDKYIMRPGDAYDVGQFIEVEDGDEDDEGSFSLMTVSMYKATPITYIISKFAKYQEAMDMTDVRQADEDDEEYNLRQLKLMTDSKFNALYVAFSKADLPFEVFNEGVYVLNVLEGSASDGVLNPGDIVTKLDGQKIEQKDDLLELLQNREKDERVKVEFERDEEQLSEVITLKEIPDSNGKIGFGITFAESKTIETTPEVEADTEEIGGPSAGLMFTLEILNQLLDEDISKGYKIAGTGEMNEDGTVGRIGGIEKKVVAADRAGVEIFFAPEDELTAEILEYNPGLTTNYAAAVKTAKEIGTTMKIVPVKTIDDALAYLEKLQQK